MAQSVAQFVDGNRLAIEPFEDVDWLDPLPTILDRPYTPGEDFNRPWLMIG